jgi:hypothetical protein
MGFVVTGDFAVLALRTLSVGEPSTLRFSLVFGVIG